MLISTLPLILAIGIDWIVGEPKCWHPLVGFGRLVNYIEKMCYHPENNPKKQIVYGVIAVCILLIPLTTITYLLSRDDYFDIIFSVLILTLCIGHKSLHLHVWPIINALQAGDISQARMYTARIVSRDPVTMHIPRATIESVLENGADGVFSALFWFLIGGAPAVLFYRLANTLDAMWGYRNPKYLYFGRFAARLDDVLNYIPARITALSYALTGKTRLALSAWRHQAHQWDSPNAGPVMASGAGALTITLGGPAQYDGQWHQRIILGYGNEPTVNDISRALRLVRHSIILWIIVLLLISGVSYA
jgi:adenosylcobinamide-phosphate synthase